MDSSAKVGTRRLDYPWNNLDSLRTDKFDIDANMITSRHVRLHIMPPHHQRPLYHPSLSPSPFFSSEPTPQKASKSPPSQPALYWH
jgi:hypothetical protein